MEFLPANNRSYGCVSTTKGKGKYQCQKCRSILDKKRYKKKAKKPRLSEDLNESSVESFQSCSEEATLHVAEKEADQEDANQQKQPATFNLLDGGEVIWLINTHVRTCTLIPQDTANSRSYTNLAVVYKSQFKVTSKDAYDKFKGFLQRQNEDVTGEDLVDGFQTFG